MLGKGVYTISEAARLAGASRRQVEHWFRPDRGDGGHFLRGEYPDFRLVSFLDLVEVALISRLREHGISLQSIRKAYPELRRLLNAAHPFGHRDVFTDRDGRRIFVEVGHATGDRALIELMTGGQHVMPPVMRPYLRHIEYDPETRLARRWEIAPGIVLDPARRTGQPIVRACGLPVAVLAAGYEANGRNAEVVADWYGVTPADVRVAVGFTSREPSGLAA